ncbi:MAG: hypothetical protein KJ811_04780, partial [Candidatus Margulisbacteria bacterium]|nr:hypothetical protein [Candidatus Margulisiibacteriota bacterium]
MAIYGNFSLGIFVLLNNWKNKINISYALTTLLTALWVTLVLFFDVSRDSAQALLLYRMATMVSAFIPIPFLYFFSVFPKEDAVPRTYQIIAWFILALFFAGISFSDLLIAGIAGQNSAHLSLVVGPAYILFVIYFLGFLAFAFYRLFERYFAYRGLARQQIVYVLLGFFLGFIFPVVTNLIMPLFGFSNLIDIGPLATIITVIFISYAITKSHLMDASIVISRAVAEIITIILLGTIYLSLVFYYQVYRAGRIDLLFLLVSIIFGVFVGHWYQKIQLFLQTTSDKLFLRGKYDYYKEVSAASTQVGQRLSLAAILGILYKTFFNVVEVADSRIFLPDNFSEPQKGSTHYVVYDRETFLPQNDGERIEIEDPLVEKLVLAREAIFLDGNLIVPCILEERLIAFFVLGKKLSEESYTDEDINLLQVLANQTAISFDHTRSYEKIAADLEA